MPQVAVADAVIAPNAGDESDLWQRSGVGDRDAQEALLLRHLEWARGVARAVFMRVRGRTDDWQDYVQNATIGLLEAIRAFDPGRCTEFRHYARARVRGSVFNGLRALRAFGSGIAFADGLEDLLDDGSDDPVDQLVAAISGLAMGHALAIQAEWAMQPVRESPYESALRGQLGERLSRHLARLGESERKIIVLHYVQHVPFVRIAEMLGVTKGRVSQLHRQGMGRLRERMMHDRWQLTF